MAFSSNLSRLMKDKGLTYEELQYLSNVAPDTVARARDERIATCKLFTLEKLAVALNVEVNDLYKWENPQRREGIKTRKK